MKNKQAYTQKEQGQVLVLLTVGIITLLGFAALAIDGGRVYSEKRFIQGVADTSSMTGALYIAQNIDAVNSTILAEAQAAAETRAGNNGYPAGTATTVSVDDSDPDYYYVTTTVTSTVEVTIGKIVYADDIGVAAKSVARVKKVRSFALGQAFYAINKSACKAIDHSGNADVTVVGSGIFSNSSCSGSKNDNAITITGSATGDFTGDITAVGGVYIQKEEDITANAVVGGASQNSLPQLDEPDCSGLPNRTASGSTLQPGIYSGGIHLTGNGNWTMEPGLYCLDGDLSINNGTLTGDDITFYLRGSSGLNINGGDISLTAPSGDAWTDGAGAYWNGMLVFQAYGNTTGLVMNGNAGSNFTGTVFVPDANCRINGSGATAAIDMQVVCDTIEFIGTADMYLVYTDANKYVPPITIDLFE